MTTSYIHDRDLTNGDNIREFLSSRSGMEEFRVMLRLHVSSIRTAAKDPVDETDLLI